MSDLRHDPINDQWVAVAKNRRDRPMEFVPLEQLRQQIICPFCKGNEDETPEALSSYDELGNQKSKDDDVSDWTVRVVTNKFPSFSNPDSTVSAPEVKGSAIHKCSRHHGVQELIIPSPRHINSICELTQQELVVTWKVAQERISELKEMDGIEHAMLFMNCRSEAGASLGHIHFQLIGSPVISHHLQSRVQRDLANREEHGCSIIESLMKWEIEQKERVVELTDRFCVVCPFASRFAFQVRIIPRDMKVDFLKMDVQSLTELSTLCRNLVEKLESQHDRPAYNMLLHLDPFKSQEAQETNWYIELVPRLTKGAGYELGTDIWVNPVPPESAARRLRS